MLRHFCLAVGLTAVLLMVACGGGTGVSNSQPPSNGGTTQTPPSLSASTSSFNFGSIFIGSTQPGSITLTNGSTTGQTINVSQITASGTGFSLVSPTTFPASIAAGKTLTVNLNFIPSTEAGFNGSLAITSDASDTNLAVILTGTGIEPGALGNTPSAIDFGNISVGTPQSNPVVLSNSDNNTTNINLSQIVVTGTGFSLSSPPTLPAAIAPGQTLTLQVTFDPASGGDATGNLAITSDATNPNLSIPLSGSAVAAGQLLASPATLSFGSVAPGNTASLTGTLTAGSSDIVVNSVTVNGSPYSFSGPVFPTTVSAGSSLPYTITFAPTSSGSFNGTVSFDSTASDSPAVQNLSGTGAQSGGGGGSGGGGSGGSGGSGGGGSGGGGTPTGAITPDFFNLDMANYYTPWPNQLGANISIWRTLGAQLRWTDIETCDGGSDPTNPCYTWTNFDHWVSKAASNSADILYTAYYTPTWASSNPTAPCQSAGLGGCYPPNDVETGDQHWKDFLTAVYTHTATTSGLEKIKYWECWNEPNVPTEYNNNSPDPNVALSDLNIMCTDLKNTIKALDPNTQFTTPAPASASGVVKWMTKWVNAGYANYADYIAFHGYVCVGQGTCVANSAETILPIIINPMQSLLASTKGTSNDVSAKPMWDTEGSDDADNVPILDPDLHAAFYARYTLVQQSSGISHYSYWGYDFGNGITLVNNPGTKNATLNTAGVAWEQIYSWTVGSAYTSPCANTTGTVWQCSLTNGTNNTIIIWDTSQSCSQGVCTTTNFQAPSSYTTYQDLAGNAHNISNHTVPIGAKPIMLQ